MVTEDVSPLAAVVRKWGKKAVTLIAGHTADLGHDPSSVDLQ